MKHIISYSGGLSSAITAEAVSKEYGRENVILLFADTLIEDEDLHRFTNQFIKKTGLKLQTIYDGRDPWQIFEDEKFQGNTRIDPCSKILKRNLIKKWIKDNYDINDIIVWVGLDCLEEHRLKRVVKRNLPINYRSWLIENDVILLPEYKKQWCEQIGIKQPRLYDYGFVHNNCGGMCVKAGLGQFKLLYEKLPKVYMYHEKRQQDLMKSTPEANRPFLRKTVNKKLYYITLKDYREKYLEKNLVSESESNEFGGCGCAL